MFAEGQGTNCLSLFGTGTCSVFNSAQGQKIQSVLQNHTKSCLLTILAAARRGPIRATSCIQSNVVQKFSIRRKRKILHKGAAKKFNSLTQSLQSLFGSE